MQSLFKNELWQSKKLPLLIIIFLTSLAFFSIFQNDFVSDDYDFILNWEKNKSWIHLPDLLKGELPQTHDHSYRPVRSLLYILSYQTWGWEVLGYHLLSLFIHLSSTVLVYYIGLSLSGRRLVATLSALLFGIHPVHTESITWITSSFDMIGIVFFLASFYLYLRVWEREEKKWIFLIPSIFLAFLAIFTYEMTFTLPLLILFYDLYFKRINFKSFVSNLKIYFLYFSPIILYLFVRFYLLGIWGKLRYVGDNTLIHILVMTKAFAKYLSILVLPLNQNFISTLDNEIVVLPVPKFPPIEVIYNPWLLLRDALIVTLIVIGALIGYKKKPFVFFCLVWFFLSLLPIIGIAPPGIIFAEKYLYLASFPILLLLAKLLVSFLESNSLLVNKLGLVLVVFITVSLSFLTYSRNLIWRDSLSLWEDTVQKSPKSSYARNNLGRAYEDLGNKDKAIEEYKQSTNLDPKGLAPRSNLAGIYLSLGEYELASDTLKEALSLAPKNPYLHYNFGIVFEKAQKFDLAREQYQKVLEIIPSFSSARTRLQILSNH